MKLSRFITVVDSHTAGEPTRVVIGGIPHVPGESMRQKKDWLGQNQDHLRTFLMHEPRGHQDMFGAIITAPTSPDTDVGVIFMDNAGYLDMCVHGSIGTVTVLLELGMADSGKLVLDTPAGRILAQAGFGEKGVEQVTIRNVPSFFYSSESLRVNDIGEIRVDIAYGGNFFALIAAAQLELDLTLDSLDKLIELGMEIKGAANEQVRIIDPQSGQQKRVELVEIFDESFDPPRNLVVFGAGQFDRSPCGTGMSAKMALLHSQGKLEVGDEYRYQSIIGTEFKGKVVDELTIGRYEAIIPEITGSAHITGIGHLILDKDDPFKEEIRFS